MCGIFGIVNGTDTTSTLVSGLSRLSYRGYDSAGIATVTRGRLLRRRSSGGLANLTTLLDAAPISGRTGIAHTRWATHGAPVQENAHPHATESVAVVHNGIVENYEALRDELLASGCIFESETDSEVIPHLITRELKAGHAPIEALRRAIRQLHGSYALAVVFKGYDDLVLGARRASPLAVGQDKQCAFLSSDVNSLSGLLEEATHLEDGDIAVLTPQGVTIINEVPNVPRNVQKLIEEEVVASLRDFPDHTLQEIHSQPAVLKRLISTFYSQGSIKGLARAAGLNFKNMSRLRLVACGSSRHAAAVASHWFEKIARLPVDVEIASDFLARNTPTSSSEGNIVISQSGETADTLEALRWLKRRNLTTLALVNVRHSTMEREADHCIHLQAGPEVGVASTKAFMAQLGWLALLAITAGIARRAISQNDAEESLLQLADLPRAVENAMASRYAAARAAAVIRQHTSCLFLGRGVHWPLAEEAALKLAELSYIHAQGFAAGELKHGPLALVTKGTPVVTFAPSDEHSHKTATSIKEVRARGAFSIVITNSDGAERLGEQDIVISLPDIAPIWSPFLQVIPAQFIAYYTARFVGNDIDKPRNLAKCVTVE